MIQGEKGSFISGNGARRHFILHCPYYGRTGLIPNLLESE